MNIVGKDLHMKKECTDLEDIKQRIGNNIRILREYKKISQKNLYEYLNKSQPTLSRYENGQATMSLDTLYKICYYLEVPIVDMLTKDLNLEYCVYLEKTSLITHSENYQHYFENCSLNLYYMSTSQENYVVEAPLISGERTPENYIPFLFEVMHNSPDKQIYEGKIVFEAQHVYFYIENKNRDERGLIITYLYSQKNKPNPIGLLGLMISTSHGFEQRPCVQKCIITSQKLDLDSLRAFLQITSDESKSINKKFISFLDKSSDKNFYDWISSFSKKNH